MLRLLLVVLVSLGLVAANPEDIKPLPDDIEANKQRKMMLPDTESVPITFEADKGRTLYISGRVDGRILQQANKLERITRSNLKPVTLIINSPGGSVFMGMQFMSAMQLAQTRGVVIRCLVPMAAASMAMIIFNECNERFALPQALFLWHGVSIGLRGRHTIKSLSVVLQDLVRISQDFDKRMIEGLNITEKQFYYHYHNDSWLPSSELKKISPQYMFIATDVKGINSKLFDIGY